jgi:predicted glutamine amidotransferase
MDDGMHECDLFLMSSHHAYAAQRALPKFARKGSRNMDGWGIGYYAAGEGRVLRSADAALDPTRGDVSREFAIAVQAVSSPVLLGHLRLSSHGAVRPENNHPFKLGYLGYDWLLIHNGTAQRAEELVPREERLLQESTCDSARVAEFLRLEIMGYTVGQPKHSLIHAVRRAFTLLLQRPDPGSLNLILSNGQLTFVLIHWRMFHLLNRGKGAGDVALLSTIKLTDDEEWLPIDPQHGRNPKMLVFSGHTLAYNGDL